MIRPLSLAEFIDWYNPLFAVDVKRRNKEVLALLGDNWFESWINQLAELSSFGKRVRPYLCYLALVEMGEWQKEKSLSLLFGLEYFHLFALIHDDLIDQAKERRGVKTLDCFIAEKIKAADRRGNSNHTGKSQAILLGDLVFSWSQNCIGHYSSKELSDCYSQMIVEVIAGQMLDVDLATRGRASRKSIDRKNDLKTATYSFVRPVEMVYALHNKKLPNDLRNFLHHLGLAFQIQDDLLDVVGKNTGKPLFQDVKEGQHTLISFFVEQNGSRELKDIWLNSFGKELSKTEQDSLVVRLEEEGVIDSVEKEMNKAFDASAGALDFDRSDIWKDLHEWIRWR